MGTIAKRSKRWAMRAGTSARTRTPSGVSSRVTSPASVVQLGEAAAVGVGHEQVERPQRVRQLALDALAELFQPFAADAADEHGIGVAQAQFVALGLVEQVGLVEHEQPWPVAGADLLERLLDGVAHHVGLLLGR